MLDELDIPNGENGENEEEEQPEVDEQEYYVEGMFNPSHNSKVVKCCFTL
jgi:hypothetical protein